MVPNNMVGHDKSSGSNPILMSEQFIFEDASMSKNMAGENTSFPVERKAEVGPLSTNSNPQLSLSSNKRPRFIGSDFDSLGFVQFPARQRTTVSQSKFGWRDLPAQPSSYKKMVRSDSMFTTRSGLPWGHTTKTETSTPESTSKGRPGSLEAVRSKMRESLAGALVLAFQNVDVSDKTQSDSAQASESNSTMDSRVPISGSEGVYPLKESASPWKTDEGQAFLTDESSGSGEKSFQEFQWSSGLPDEDVPFGDDFFLQDDLLQGHGLSWAFDFDVQVMRDEMEKQSGENPEIVKDENQNQRVDLAIFTPENLALKIEDELFKIFGDVNKKYKEKGRSLLFNLKDRNNPELRERVMSGEISPQKLCSMSAEELASKELSQWRMAKAEELAQMVVLPDNEVDIRHLVRKTHKGEFQVEIEHDDGIAADVSGGTSMLMQPQPKKETEAYSPSEGSVKDKAAGQECSSEEQKVSGSLVIPTNGTNLMQGMIVDELKDAEFLPPIVSLDEFMKSLNSEPPFDSLSKDVRQHPKVLSDSRAAKRASESAKDSSSRKAGNAKKREDAVETPRGRAAKLESLPSAVSKIEYIWDGVLKLNSSSSVTVGGIYQSGESTSTKEWPRTLEMKGRVKLEAFEKFLQELPRSRSRAVMVIHFVFKNNSSSVSDNLSEAIEAYSMDQRLGYAEPSHGTELYLLPHTSRITNLLDKQMSKDRPPSNDTMGKSYLIGVVVWRRARAHTSSNIISPNSSSHQKHSSKKQLATPLKRVQDSSNAETDAHSRTLPEAFSKSHPQTEEDDNDNDDIPPGFGPRATAQPVKDDDDLPEYNFSGDLNPSMPRISPQNLDHGTKTSQCPVDQMRDLIKRYGQGGTSSVNNSSWADDKNLGFEPWNDDDDDIPEWRPEDSHQPHKQQRSVAYHEPHRRQLHPMVRDHQLQVPPMPPINNQQFAPTATHQLPTEHEQGHLGRRWGQPPGPLHSARWRRH